jgi:hypothetical protein
LTQEITGCGHQEVSPEANNVIVSSRARVVLILPKLKHAEVVDCLFVAATLQIFTTECGGDVILRAAKGDTINGHAQFTLISGHSNLIQYDKDWISSAN